MVSSRVAPAVARSESLAPANTPRKPRALPVPVKRKSPERQIPTEAEVLSLMIPAIRSIVLEELLWTL